LLNEVAKCPGTQEEKRKRGKRKDNNTQNNRRKTKLEIGGKWREINLTCIIVG
jgi:hypothetical protein